MCNCDCIPANRFRWYYSMRDKSIVQILEEAIFDSHYFDIFSPPVHLAIPLFIFSASAELAANT